MVLRARYVLEEVIGRGAHSLVFSAKDLHRAASDGGEGAHVALKTLQASCRHDARAQESLAREFNHMQRLAHPSIPRVFDFDCDGDIWFMTMELVRGETVATWLRTCPAMDDSAQIIKACADALQYAHSMCVIHGDLKPSNLLVTTDRQIKLIDFGSAPGQSDQGGWRSATPFYASPQVLAGKRPEREDDVFSLACLAYEIFSRGKRPFGERSSLEAYNAHLMPVPIAGMPEHISAALRRGLARDRIQRLASPLTFTRELFAHEVDLAKQPPAAAPSGPERLWLAVAASLVIFCALAFYSLLMLLPPGRPASAPRASAAVSAAARPERAAGMAMPIGFAATMLGAEPADETPDADAATKSVSSRPGGAVTFEDATLVASAAQRVIAIPIRRVNSTRGSAAVEWSLDRAGSIVDTDSMGARVVRFSDGETARSLFIPLRPHNSVSGTAGSAPRSFTVWLRPVGGGIRLGPLTRVTVTIVPQPAQPELRNAVAASFSAE